MSKAPSHIFFHLISSNANLRERLIFFGFTVSFRFSVWNYWISPSTVHRKRQIGGQFCLQRYFLTLIRTSLAWVAISFCVLFQYFGRKNFLTKMSSLDAMCKVSSHFFCPHKGQPLAEICTIVTRRLKREEGSLANLKWPTRPVLDVKLQFHSMDISLTYIETEGGHYLGKYDHL